MNAFIFLGFGIGLFFGIHIGLIIMAAIAAGHRADEQAELQLAELLGRVE